VADCALLSGRNVAACSTLARHPQARTLARAPPLARSPQGPCAWVSLRRRARARAAPVSGRASVARHGARAFRCARSSKAVRSRILGCDLPSIYFTLASLLSCLGLPNALLRRMFFFEKKQRMASVADQCTKPPVLETLGFGTQRLNMNISRYLDIYI
jgi:hypothetical protein